MPFVAAPAKMGTPPPPQYSLKWGRNAVPTAAEPWPTLSVLEAPGAMRLVWERVQSGNLSTVCTGFLDGSFIWALSSLA